MNLYLISQDVNTEYDTYDAAVVAAASEKSAQKKHPGGGGSDFGSWATPEKVKVKLIGKAVRGTKAGVILASFNAG